jgi:hypothetical protein
MEEVPETIATPTILAAPRDPDLQALHAYWQRKRGERLMPSRAAIDPLELRALLPHIVLYNVEGLGGPYTVRLVGTAIVEFMGQDLTGKRCNFGLEEPGATRVIRLLDSIVTGREPRFVTGKALWCKNQQFRSFESTSMPLSADGETVNMILAGVKFDVSMRGLTP